MRFKDKQNIIYSLTVAGSSQQSLRVVTEDENRCTDHSSPVEKTGRYRYSLNMRVLPPLLSRGESTNPRLDKLLLFFSGLTSKKDLLSTT